jgi:DNA invertase Pin-like site-specific DNA recombinase
MVGDSQDYDYAAQVELLKEAGCEQIFSDRGEDWVLVGMRRSIREARPPELVKLLKVLQPGDVVTVIELDRLGPSRDDRGEIFVELDLRGCEFVCLDGEVLSWRLTAQIHRLYKRIRNIWGK